MGKFGMVLNHNNFSENLKYAQKGEKTVISYLTSYFPGIKVKSYNSTKDYDILAEYQNNILTFEIKEDIRCKDTNNVVIEYESRNKPSGIQTTKADYWVFILHRQEGLEYWLIKTDRLKTAILNKEYTNLRQMTHTDSCNKLIFFKYSNLIKLGYKINNG